METIQVVLDSKLLRAANGAARRAKVNRSALVREALREYLKRLRSREAEARDRRGYLEHPIGGDDIRAWEGVASWPER